MRESLLNLSLVKPGKKAEEILKKYELFINGNKKLRVRCEKTC